MIDLEELRRIARTEKARQDLALERERIKAKITLIEKLRREVQLELYRYAEMGKLKGTFTVALVGQERHTDVFETATTVVRTKELPEAKLFNYTEGRRVGEDRWELDFEFDISEEGEDA